MKIEIRRARAEDAREYALCHIACWQSAYRGIIPDAHLDNMSNEIEARVAGAARAIEGMTDCSFFYAALEDRMIGRLIFGKSRDEDMPDAGEIQALYLLGEYWDMGFGAQMMSYAIDALKNMGHREIILWVLDENKRARRFYEKFNFVFDGTKKEIEVGRTLLELRYALKL